MSRWKDVIITHAVKKKSFFKLVFWLVLLLLVGSRIRFQQKPEKGLELGSEMEEIAQASPFAVPEGIHPAQLQEFFKWEDTYFALFRKANLNFPIFDVDHTLVRDTRRSGVLYAKEGDSVWKVFVEIKETADSKNNPIYLWKENVPILLLVADTDGAGSGEGVAKLMISKDNGASWTMEKCFYLDLVFIYDEVRKGRSFLRALEEYKRQDSYDEYILNPVTGKYEFEQFNKYSGETETVTNDSCQNFVISKSSMTLSSIVLK